METTLSPIQSYEIQYSGWMYVFPAKDADFWENQKSILQNILDKRESGELSDLEKKNWGNKSDELLKRLINDYDKQITGYKIESVYVFSKKGNKYRRDIFRLNESPKHHFYLYDGIEGYVVFPEKNEVIASPSFCKRWKDPLHSNGYGFNLDQFLKHGCNIKSLDRNTHRLSIESIYENEGVNIEFELLDENDAYWTKAKWIDDKGEIRDQVICEEFKDHEGIKIPKIIKIQKREMNELCDFISLTLANVTINDTDFPDAFFEKPQGDKYIVKNYNR